jgi:hypothetical protein
MILDPSTVFCIALSGSLAVMALSWEWYLVPHCRFPEHCPLPCLCVPAFLLVSVPVSLSLLYTVTIVCLLLIVSGVGVVYLTFYRIIFFIIVLP